MNKFLLIAVLGLICTSVYALDCAGDEYEDGTCKKCSATFNTQCLTCSKDECETCSAGYYVDTTTKKCVVCPTGCSACDSATKCTGDCKLGYGKDGDLCTACTDDQCSKCTAAKDTCTVCKDGYAAKDGDCDACSTTNCATCTDVDTCATCKDGFFLDSSKTPKVCTACLDNCAKCKSATTCDTCETYYYKNTTGTTVKCLEIECETTDCKSCNTEDVCAICIELYGLDDEGDCKICKNGCADCDNFDDYCESCPENSTINDTKADATFCCPTNCTSCESSTKCLGCKEGWTLSDKTNLCSSGFKTGASLTLGAILSVALFSLLF